MKEIPLTQGKVAIVDDNDFERLSIFRWYYHQKRDKRGVLGWGYAERTLLKSDMKGRGHTTMHQEIMKLPTGLFTDHINGDGLDNRKENLRMVTHRQNCQNQTRRKKTSKYLGVSWNTRTGKWYSHITYNKKLRHLGIFQNEIDAATAYRVACAVLVGE